MTVFYIDNDLWTCSQIHKLQDGFRDGHDDRAAHAAKCGDWHIQLLRKLHKSVFKFRKSQSSKTTAGENAADFAGGAIVEHWTASLNPIRQRSDSVPSAAISHCKQVCDKAQIERPCRDKSLESLMQRWTVGYAKAPSQVCKAQILCPYLCAWRHQSGCEQSHVH